MSRVPSGSEAEVPRYIREHLTGHVVEAGRPGWKLIGTRPDMLDRVEPESLTGDALRGFEESSLIPEVVGSLATQHLMRTAAADDRHGLRQLGMARAVGTRTFDAAVSDGRRGWRLSSAVMRHQSPHVTIGVAEEPAFGVSVAEEGPLAALLTGRDARAAEVWSVDTAARYGERLALDVTTHAVCAARAPDGALAVLTGHHDGTVWRRNPVSGAAEPVFGNAAGVVRSGRWACSRGGFRLRGRRWFRAHPRAGRLAGGSSSMAWRSARWRWRPIAYSSPLRARAT